MPQPAPLPFNRVHIHPGDRICAAVSGGADSVALLLTLHAANTAKHNALGVGLSAAHVQHGIRSADESAADLDFVRDLCASLEVPLHIHHADVPARAARTGETIEEAARAVRYDFFSTLIASGHADSILTAHTLDDQAETVLMKFLRGAWTEGLSAIHPVVLVNNPGQRPGKILRPFLHTRRSEIESFLKQSNQPWREDPTNADPAYTRNRIRHQLMPLLREYNPSLDQTLSNLAELAREEDSRWQAELSRILPQILLPGKPVRGGGRAVSTTPGESQSIVAIELDRLKSLDPALRRRVIRAAARQLGSRLSFDETARILALCGFQPYPPVGAPTVAARAGAFILLANGLRAERSARELRLLRPPATIA